MCFHQSVFERTRVKHPSTVEDDDMRKQRSDLLGVVGDVYDHAFVSYVNALYRKKQLLSGSDVETCSRLVENENIRLIDECPQNQNFLLFTVTKITEPLMHLCIQPSVGKHRQGEFLLLSAGLSVQAYGGGKPAQHHVNERFPETKPAPQRRAHIPDPLFDLTHIVLSVPFPKPYDFTAARERIACSDLEKHRLS